MHFPPARKTARAALTPAKRIVVANHPHARAGTQAGRQKTWTRRGGSVRPYICQKSGQADIAPPPPRPARLTKTPSPLGARARLSMYTVQEGGRAAAQTTHQWLCGMGLRSRRGWEKDAEQRQGGKTPKESRESIRGDGQDVCRAVAVTQHSGSSRTQISASCRTPRQPPPRRGRSWSSSPWRSRRPHPPRTRRRQPHRQAWGL